MMERKTVSFTLTNLNTEGRIFEGYASTFGNLDLADDVVHPGAFAKTLAERGSKVKVLWQHDVGEPIGRPLILREDQKGLWIQALVSDTARGRDAMALLHDGAINEMSIGYDPMPAGTDYSKDSKGRTVRNLREVRLWEVSLVAFPANPQAMVTALKEAEALSPSLPEPVLEPEVKAGRVLSRANATRLRNALGEISEILKAARLLEDEADDAPDKDSEKSTPVPTGEEDSQEHKAEQAGPEPTPPTAEEKSAAGPDVTPPTCEFDRKAAELAAGFWEIQQSIVEVT
jgi:HK97 family phage prohead protease